MTKKIKTNNYCIDCTKKFMNNINIKKNATLKNAEYIDIKGKRYYKNKQNKIILKFNEEKVAKWIQKKLHKDVEYLFDITQDENVRLGDYKINRTEVWELKTIKGNGKRTLDSAIKDKKEQATIFIFDLTFSKMEDIEAIEQSIDIFRRRNWVDKIILKKNNDVLKVFNKKRN